jgi:hypothetical protein
METSFTTDAQWNEGMDTSSIYDRIGRYRVHKT